MLYLTKIGIPKPYRPLISNLIPSIPTYSYQKLRFCSLTLTNHNTVHNQLQHKSIFNRYRPFSTFRIINNLNNKQRFNSSRRQSIFNSRNNSNIFSLIWSLFPTSLKVPVFLFIICGGFLLITPFVIFLIPPIVIFFLIFNKFTTINKRKLSKSRWENIMKSHFIYKNSSRTSSFGSFNSLNGNATNNTNLINKIQKQISSAIDLNYKNIRNTLDLPLNDIDGKRSISSQIHLSPIKSIDEDWNFSSTGRQRMDIYTCDLYYNDDDFEIELNPNSNIIAQVHIITGNEKPVQTIQEIFFDPDEGKSTLIEIWAKKRGPPIIIDEDLTKSDDNENDDDDYRNEDSRGYRSGSDTIIEVKGRTISKTRLD